MQLEIAPLWSNSNGHEHITGYQIVAIDYVSGFKTVDQIATYSNENDARNARERILKAAPLRDD